MLVKDLMTKDVSSCSPENNLAELAKIMRNDRCGALPILDNSEESRVSLRIEISVLPLERRTSGHRTCSHERFHLLGVSVAVLVTMCATL